MNAYKTVSFLERWIYGSSPRRVHRKGSGDGMRAEWLVMFLISLLFAGQALAAGEAAMRIGTTMPGGVVTVERLIEDGKVLLSVRDAAQAPMFGLTSADFKVTAGGRTAKITSVEPVSESLDVPRHIVMVLDNSDSMRQRNAIAPLLAGVDELLKIVRPIDQMQVVVFSKEKMSVGGRELYVRTFTSNQPVELKNFVAAAYRDGITSTTVLYEGMLAGLGLMAGLPPNEPRFMVVFSDGEDLNSACKSQDVLRAAEGVDRFHAYAIDYMPGATKDKLLTSFAEGNHGEIWKATSETNLIPIFQSVASKMQYYYVVSYLFPTTGSLAVVPASLTIDEVENFEASATTQPPAAVPVVARRLDAAVLALRPAVDTVYGIASWKVALANNNGPLAAQAGKGTPATEIMIPLDTYDLGKLAAGGDIKVSMELQDSKGQTIILNAPPVKLNLVKTSGSLAVAPASLTIEEIKTIDASPMLGYVYFPEGSSDIPSHYVRFAGTEETASFDEQRFRDTLEKYHQVLNIVGKRLTDHPEAVITVTGCNANTGPEKGNRKLAAARATAVGDYLRTVWNVAPERILTDARNLPEMPSTSRREEGRAENRRVEIRSDVAAILAPVRSTYLATRIDAAVLILRPVINAPHQTARWKVAVANGKKNLGELAGEGKPPTEIKVPLQTGNLGEMATSGDLAVRMTVQDRMGQELAMTAVPVRINFIQTSKRLAEKQDFRVQEKYALILFDFDSDAISAGNQEIVNGIVARIKELPEATTEIVGHTDNIGKENYNLKLSERRALTVYQLLTTDNGSESGERIQHRGIGPDEPLFDNQSPEARAFNRTVTITLEYMQGE